MRQLLLSFVALAGLAACGASPCSGGECDGVTVSAVTTAGGTLSLRVSSTNVPGDGRRVATFTMTLRTSTGLPVPNSAVALYAGANHTNQVAQGATSGAGIF